MTIMIPLTFLKQTNKMEKKQLEPFDILKLLVLTHKHQKSELRHPKCKAYQCNAYMDPIEYNCEYDTKIDCDECRYGKAGGRKNPEAKCNQNK